MEVLERIANHEFAGELRVIVEALIPLRGNREETEDYLRETLMCGAYKDFHKEDLRDALLDAIRGNDKYTFGYAYYFLGAWKNRTSGCVVVEDAFLYGNKSSIRTGFFLEERCYDKTESIRNDQLENTPIENEKKAKEISINLYDVLLLFLIFVIIGFVLYDLYIK
mgnify:CR=1 FL=1